MRVLIDTNIIIHREANRIINEDIGFLFNWLDRLGYEKCVHPLSIEEISTHQDEQVVNTMKIKITNYNLLRTESPDDELIQQIRESDKTKNDFIDTSIVKEVYNKRVDYLITEDRGIHRKAEILGCSERIFKIDAFLEKCIAENPALKDYKVLAAKKAYIGNINIKDPFFDSFKEDYKEFETWFNKKSDAESYVCITDGSVKAFLYIKVEDKDENYSDITPLFAPKKRLKIGTFKVVSTGYKLGERFLKIIFDNAIANQVDEIYVTIFDKREEQQRLVLLLEDWGFKLWGTKKTGNGIENVYVRDFKKKVLENPRESFPYINRNARVFLNPIWEKYHTELFPDSYLNNESPHHFVENEPHRNALKKVYISRSYFSELISGDIILFYRTGGYHKSVISTIGVVENVIKDIKNESDFIRLCRKRSVFDDDELKEWWNYNPYKKPIHKIRRPFIVNFLYIDTFPMPKVNMKRLIEIGIIPSVNDAPRGFVQIENSKFEIFLKEAKANESYFVD
jgi:hypothetical protein